MNIFNLKFEANLIKLVQFLNLPTLLVFNKENTKSFQLFQINKIIHRLLLEKFEVKFNLRHRPMYNLHLISPINMQQIGQKLC